MGTKYPSETRPIIFHLAPLIPGGAGLSGSPQGGVTQQGLLLTTLSAPIVAGDLSVQLPLHPGVGAKLIVSLGSDVDEETFKVLSPVTGGPPYICPITPTAEFPHSGSVSYAVGETARFLVSATGTVSGTDVIFRGQRGADDKHYDVWVIAPLTNGESVEDEQDIFVSEVTSDTVVEKQPSEILDLPFDFTKKIPETTTMTSAIAWVSRILVPLPSTQVAGTGGTINTSTIQLAIHPGVGATLIIDPAGLKRERVKVTSVSGAVAPFTATVDPPLWYGHSSGEAVDYEPGSSTRLLTSTTASVVPATGEATVRSRLGAANQEYRVNLLGTCSDGSKIQGQALLHVIEQ
jgi:hypothetical protein